MIRLNEPAVYHEKIGDEIVAIHYATGRYYAIRCAGTVVWELLSEQPRTRDSLLQDLARYFELPIATIQAEIEAFLDTLDAEELTLKISAQSGKEEAATTPDSTSSPKYSPPIIEIKQDMEDMILLDPIHDIGKHGWPESEG
jgi:hypothetical protein